MGLYKRRNVVDQSHGGLDRVYLNGLYKRHRETCARIDCFCRQTVIYDAKKNREIVNDNIMMTPGVFAKYY